MEKKTIAMLAIFLMLSIAVSPVIAQAPYDVPTNAVITPGGSPPIVKWKWELPDEDPTVVCTQVWPVPFGNKTVTTYIVATDPNGADDIQDVYIKVFYPNGTEKYQIHAVELPKTGEIISAIDKGVANGCIPPDVAADMKLQLGSTASRAYKAEFIMHYHQPPGCYKVVASAVDKNGEIGKFENLFGYYSLKFLAIDFAAGVNFGSIKPCTKQVVAGDWDMATPNKPTVRSGGNVPLWISVHFTAMVGANEGKKIEDFDAKFKDEELVFKACNTVTFTNPLNACQTEKISFSIHAPMGTPADTYTGTLRIAIAP